MAKSGVTAPLGVIVLAAGLGKRMHSTLPKVLHSIGGQPLILHILNRLEEIVPHADIAVVVGHGREQVEAAIRQDPRAGKMKIAFVVQSEQRGTGHAARCAMDSPWGEKKLNEKAAVLVLPGDQPLIDPSLVYQMTSPLNRGDALRLLTCEVADPTGYGRVVRRGKKGPVLRIVEEKDANVREKTIREVATSTYLFQAGFLHVGLQKLSNKNAQGEFYLTDLVAQAARAKKKTDVLLWHCCEDVRGINDPWELAQAGRILNERQIRMLSRQGVKFIDPCSSWVDVMVQIQPGATIHPGAILKGSTRIAAGAVIGPNVVLTDTEIGKDVQIKAGTIAEKSQVQAGAQVGPYAHLRPESVVGPQAKIGNFVELKKARIGEKTSVAHLSYLGDAEVGKNVNIGCGFVTCNFDGRIIEGERKHRTIIEDEVFLGSDCQAIAPVRIGRGAYVASGSTITEDVEPESLAIARSRQVNKPGYARKLKNNASGE